MTIENIEPADSPLPFMVKVTEARTTLHEYAAMCLKELGENAPEDRCWYCGCLYTMYQKEWKFKHCPDCGMPLDVEAK